MKNDQPGTRCPNCKLRLVAELNRSSQDDKYSLALRKIDDKFSDLNHAFLCYLRWKAEGEKIPYNSFQQGNPQPTQMYYDDYHSHIEYDPEQDNYKFNIQTSDSPEGDTWWRGRFKVWGGCQIQEILEESTANY